MNKPYVLVVDDNKITTKLLRRYLEANGFETGEAFDGVECLEKVQARKPDTIVLDVMMPRMDGYEAVAILKGDENTKNIPVVIVTALNDLPNQLKSIESGGDDFLSKPIEEKLLVAKVRLLTELNQAKLKANQYRVLLDKVLANQISHDEAKSVLVED